MRIQRFEVSDGPGSFSWYLNATHINVNVSSQTWVEYGRPTNLSEPHGRIAKGPATYADNGFSNVTANSTSRSKFSALESNSQRDLTPDLLQIRGEFGFGPREPDPKPLPAQVAYPAPANATWVTGTQGLVELGGNFSLHVRDAAVYLRNQTNSSVFESGNRTTGIGQAPPGQPHPIREYHEQKIRLDVTGGRMELRPVNKLFSLASPTVRLEGNVTATFHDVDGFIRGSGNDITIRKAVWQVHGSIRLDSNTETGSTLIGRLEATADVLGLDPTPVLPETGAGNLATGRPEFSWPIVVVATPTMMAFGLLGLAVYRRGRPPTIDDVEAALLTKEHGRARTLARRLAKQEPDNAVAVFLLATALGAEEDYGRLLREVEPLAARLSVRRRVGIAYVLAVAGSKEGQAERSLRWASEAAREPEFRSLLIAEGIPAKSATTPAETGYV